jgi:hypothetical protein
MSDYTIQCPHCEQELEVPEEMAGQNAECPACNKDFVIPPPTDNTEQTPAEGETPDGAISSTGSDELCISCPHCAQQLEVPEDIIGENVECPACNEEFVIPKLETDSHKEQSAHALINSSIVSSSEPQPEPSNANRTNGGSIDAHENSIVSVQENISLTQKLRSRATAAAGKVKRGAQIAAMKAQTEKLRRLDLQRAYQVLGKRIYDIRYNADEFQQIYDAILSLEHQITELRAGGEKDEFATVTEKAKTAATNVKMKAQAEVLSHKRNGKLIALGQKVAQQRKEVPTEIEAEMLALDEVQREIEAIDKQINETKDAYATRVALGHESETISSSNKVDSCKSSKREHAFFSAKQTSIVVVATSLVLVTPIAIFLYSKIASNIKSNHTHQEKASSQSAAKPDQPKARPIQQDRVSSQNTVTPHHKEEVRDYTFEFRVTKEHGFENFPDIDRLGQHLYEIHIHRRYTYDNPSLSTEVGDDPRLLITDIKLNGLHVQRLKYHQTIQVQYQDGSTSEVDVYVDMPKYAKTQLNEIWESTMNWSIEELSNKYHIGKRKATDGRLTSLQKEDAQNQNEKISFRFAFDKGTYPKRFFFTKVNDVIPFQFRNISSIRDLGNVKTYKAEIVILHSDSKRSSDAGIPLKQGDPVGIEYDLWIGDENSPLLKMDRYTQTELSNLYVIFNDRGSYVAIVSGQNGFRAWSLERMLDEQFGLKVLLKSNTEIASRERYERSLSSAKELSFSEIEKRNDLFHSFSVDQRSLTIDLSEKAAKKHLTELQQAEVYTSTMDSLWKQCLRHPDPDRYNIGYLFQAFPAGSKGTVRDVRKHVAYIDVPWESPNARRTRSNTRRATVKFSSDSPSGFETLSIGDTIDISNYFIVHEIEYRRDPGDRDFVSSYLSLVRNIDDFIFLLK